MKKFTYATRISLRETDATGVLYFADQFKLALEGLEAYLVSAGSSLGQLLCEGEFLLPIVHAEGDYFAPLRLSDEVEISLNIAKVGTTSLTLDYEFFHAGKRCGRVSIVHVSVSKETQKPVPLPEKLLELFNVSQESFLEKRG